MRALLERICILCGRSDDEADDDCQVCRDCEEELLERLVRIQEEESNPL